MVDCAGDGDHEILRAVVGAVMVPHSVPGGRLNRLRVTTDRAAKRMLTEHGLEEPLARDIRWIIVGHREFFQNDTALGLELCRVKQAGGEHVGDDVDGHRKIAILHLGVIAGVLLGCDGVVFATDRVEAHRNVEGRTSLRSLEQKVLEEVR